MKFPFLHLLRRACLPAMVTVFLTSSLAAADLTVAHNNGALLFPVTQQLAGSASEQGLIQDHQGLAIADAAKSIRVPDGTTVHVVSETTVTYTDANGTSVAVPVVRVKLTSDGLTDGKTGHAVVYQASAGYMLKERLH